MDGSGVRSVAAEVGELAGRARQLAGEVQAVGAVEWRSGAADVLRRRLGEESGRLHRLAGSLDEARGSVLRHAAAVDRGPSSAVAAAFLGAGAVLL